MKILGLCMFTDEFDFIHDFEFIDLSLGKDIFSLPNDYGKVFDLVLGAPPCNQFTKANTGRWLEDPVINIAIALKCLVICEKSGKPWIIENPPGRLERLIPSFKKYRQITLSDLHSNKEWVLYSNLPLTRPNNKRYGKTCVSNGGTVKRNTYPKYFFTYLSQQLHLFGLLPGQHPGLHPDLSSGQYSGLILDLLLELNPDLNEK